uniref:Nuclear pore complex protein Nup85 n=1 Tax=Glossina pallidipes TaxID=7398 RepID=A0A1B0A4K4_GLOPL
MANYPGNVRVVYIRTANGGLHKLVFIFINWDQLTSRKIQALRTKTSIMNLDPLITIRNLGRFDKFLLGNVSPLHIEKPDYYYRFMPSGDPSSGEPEIKTDEQIHQMRVGVKTDEVDARLHELIISSNACPSALCYTGFPKSICTSVNDVAYHGIPNDRCLVDGDIDDQVKELNNIFAKVDEPREEICKVQAKKSFTEERYGNALEWAIRSKDTFYVTSIADYLLKCLESNLMPLTEKKKNHMEIHPHYRLDNVEQIINLMRLAFETCRMLSATGHTVSSPDFPLLLRLERKK